ncbi:MAG: hypothetical protein LC104_06480 [Bacteroidales bacterium]|nr:hypothetical protein [Bacteroidales bacterium]
MNCSRLRGVIFGCLVIGILIGCEGASTTELNGRVTLDNQPVDNGSISLFGTTDANAKVSASIVNGEYVIDAQRGLKPGEYKVEIHWLKPTGKTIPSADPGFTMDETREAIPRKYHDNTELTVQVDVGRNTKDFLLMSK